MDHMDEALMAGGAFSDKEMKKYREQKISKLAELLPPLCSTKVWTGKKLARWMMDNSSSIIALIKYGDEK